MTRHGPSPLSSLYDACRYHVPTTVKYLYDNCRTVTLHDTEVKQIEFEARPDGNTVTEKIDADEDRRIVGFEWSVHDTTKGNPHELKGHAYVGVDPRPSISSGSGDVKDIGGKFHTHCNSVVSTDSTNGWAYALNHYPAVNPEDGLSWDWNEDVTLTIEAQEESGQGGVLVTFQLYYVEDTGSL